MAEPKETAGLQVTVSRSNPFPGLRAFDPVEHYLYFGRSEQTVELMSRLRSTHFLSVVGTSGSGKSSLVLAGLVPGLHGGFMTGAGSSWRVAIMRPGGDPIGHLAAELAKPEVIGEEGEDEEIARSMIEAALRGSSLGLAQSVEISTIPERDNVLIVVDQFEELFRFKQSTLSGVSREEGVAFVKLLLEAVERPGRLYIVITMRSDFIGDCMEFPGLPEAINEGQYLVPRMSRDELREAITGPVGVAGGKISPRLVSRLLNEVGDELDQLPVMQHALMRMWGYWEESGREGSIDLEQYNAIGTMKNALSLHAEKAYQELAEGRERKIAERLFKTLTELEGEGRGIRRPARLSELCEITDATEEEVAAVIGHFRIPGRSFLMPPSSKRLAADSIVDISHESLMRNWERLTAWTEEEAASATIYRRLSEAALHHEAGEGGLWRSPELDLGLAWRDENEPTATWARRYDPDFERAIAFLEESAQVRDEYAQRRERAERQRRKRKRFFLGFSALLLLLVFFFWNNLQEQKHLKAVTVALSEDDPLLKALVLSEVPDRPLDRLSRLIGRPKDSAGGLEFEALRHAAYDRIPVALFRNPDLVPLTSAAISGAWVVTGSENGVVGMWSSDGRGDAVYLVAPPPRGAKGDQRAKAHLSEITSVSFGGPEPERDLVLTSSVDRTARVWKAEASQEGEGFEGRLIKTLSGHRRAVTSAAFSSAGDLIVTSSADGTAKVWNLEQDKPIKTYSEHRGEVLSAAFYPPDAEGNVSDSRADWILTVSEADPDRPEAREVREARIWRAESGETLWAQSDSDLRGAWFIPPSPAPAKTPGRVLTTFAGGMVRVSDVDGPGGSVEYPMHSREVRGAAISSNGKWILTFAADATASLWRPEKPARFKALPPQDATVVGACFGRGSELLATVYADGVVSVWDTNAERIWSARGHVGPIVETAFDENPGVAVGARLLTAGQDATARIWPFEAGEPRLLEKHGGKVSGIEFRPPRAGESGDSLLLVTASDDGTARLWTDIETSPVFTGDLVHSEGAKLTDVAFSQSGDRLVTSSADKLAKIWNLEGEQLAVLRGHAQAVTSAAFDPEGGQVVTSSNDGTARIWTDLEGDEPRVLTVLKDPFVRRTYVESSAFGPLSEAVVTVSSDGMARVWSVDGELEARLGDLQGATVKSALFGASRREILVAAGITAHLWRQADSPPASAPVELESGADLTSDELKTRRLKKLQLQSQEWKESVSFKGHLDSITGATFSQDFDKVVTSSADGTVRVWSAETGDELYVLRVGDGVKRARLSPDGGTVATVSDDGAVKLWRVTEQGLRDYLKSSTSACLTVEERRLFLREWEPIAKRRFEKCRAKRSLTESRASYR